MKQNPKNWVSRRDPSVAKLEAALAALRLVAVNDPDHAKAANGMGFAISDVTKRHRFVAMQLYHFRSRSDLAVLTNVGKGIIGDHGALQAELFDAFFLTLNHGAHERLRINYHDHDYARFLWLVQNRLYDWVPLTELAGWCLPTDLVSKDRFNACFYLRSRLVRPLLWLGLIERHHEDDRLLRIEGRRYRKTLLCDRFMHFNFIQDMSITIH